MRVPIEDQHTTRRLRNANDEKGPRGNGKIPTDYLIPPTTAGKSTASTVTPSRSQSERQANDTRMYWQKSISTKANATEQNCGVG